MQIEHGVVVSFHYALREQGGDEVEASDADQPMLYLHGYGGLLEALQEGLEGHKAGDSVVVKVPAAQAYGLRRENSVHRVPIKHVIGMEGKPGKSNSRSMKLNPGQVISVNTPEGARDATVVKAGKFNVDIDTNHPLAGKDLEFSVEIVDVRESTAEEKQHGHAHGPGGHQHD